MGCFCSKSAQTPSSTRAAHLVQLPEDFSTNSRYSTSTSSFGTGHTQTRNDSLPNRHRNSIERLQDDLDVADIVLVNWRQNEATVTYQYLGTSPSITATVTRPQVQITAWLSHIHHNALKATTPSTRTVSVLNLSNNVPPVNNRPAPLLLLLELPFPVDNPNGNP